MAVQQNKKSPSKRGMHRSHNAIAAPGTGIETVLDELLDDGCGPFNHLAGSNLVGHYIRQNFDSPVHVIVNACCNTSTSSSGRDHEHLTHPDVIVRL